MCGGIADAGAWGTERGATGVGTVGAAWATLEPNSASVFCYSVHVRLLGYFLRGYWLILTLKTSTSIAFMLTMRLMSAYAMAG